MINLINYLKQSDFFSAPASTIYHGNYKGGLAEHSLNIYTLFKEHRERFNLKVSDDTMVICSILHDVCKIGKYIIEDGVSRFNPYFIHKGHSKLSLKRIQQFIELTKEEKEIILYHMGPYGTHEFSKKTGEYSIKEMTDCYNKNKLAKLFYFCDDMTSMFLEEKRS